MHQEEHELAFCSLLAPQSTHQLPNKTRAHHNTKKLLRWNINYVPIVFAF